MLGEDGNVTIRCAVDAVVELIFGAVVKVLLVSCLTVVIIGVWQVVVLARVLSRELLDDEVASVTFCVDSCWLLADVLAELLN